MPRSCEKKSPPPISVSGAPLFDHVGLHRRHVAHLLRRAPTRCTTPIASPAPRTKLRRRPERSARRRPRLEGAWCGQGAICATILNHVSYSVRVESALAPPDRHRARRPASQSLATHARVPVERLRCVRHSPKPSGRAADSDVPEWHQEKSVKSEKLVEANASPEGEAAGYYWPLPKPRKTRLPRAQCTTHGERASAVGLPIARSTHLLNSKSPNNLHQHCPTTTVAQ